MLLAATGGTPRHALVIDDQLRPLFAYMRALTLPTSVYAAPEDWATTELGTRIERAATELAVMVRAGVEQQVADAGWSGYQHQFAGNASRARAHRGRPRFRLPADAARGRRPLGLRSGRGGGGVRFVLELRQPAEALGQVPVALAEELHGGREQDGADDRGVDQDRGGEPDADLLGELV